MAKFNIISKDGELVRFSGCPKYTGTFLGVSFLEFMSIESPTLIEWEIGDYIDYDRTGLRYKLYSLPIPKKQARAGANGASFVYSNVKFYAETKDLEIAPFRDIVPEDNKIHFSTRPDVSTYENVYGLARRIQACMDDVFPDKWRIEVYNTDDAKLLETLNETKDFSISNSNCLQTLSQIYEKWDNVGWIHSYDSAQDKHIITIGRSSIRDNENTSDAFAYGLGNGLTSIKKASTNEDEFATRLYVYGSDRNIQTRYYKGFNILNAESVDIRNLMLPISTWGKTDGLPDARKAYLEADESIVAKYGLIPRTVYFDGSQNEAIYPSIQGLKMSQVREEMIAAGQEDSKHLPPNENIRIDKTGYIIISLNSMIFDLGDGSKADVESNPTFLLSLPAVGFDIAEQGALTSEGLATISMKSGPCAGREFKVKSYWGYTNQLPYGYHAYEVYRNWDESLGLGFPNKTYKINEGDEYVLLDIPMPDYYITLAEKRLLEAGQKKLAECTKISPYYEPAIDSIIIKESGKTLREGMYMQISDTDIIDTEDGKDYVLIDTLTIDEKAEIPKYSVTLRKQKKTSKSFAALESRVGASEKSLSTLTSEKAGKSDTYSKANIDNLLKKYLLLEAIKQTVKGDIELEGNLKVKGDIFSTGQFAAAAVGAEGGGSVGATYLSDLYDVSLGSLLSGDILSWNGSEWVNIKQSSLVPDLSGYLPKSGGEISGVSATPLIIKASNTSEIGIAYSMNDATKGWIGYNPTYGTTLYNYASNAYLGIRDNGKAYLDNNELYHAGNFNPSDYLPKSGGTIGGLLSINDLSSANPLIYFQTNGTIKAGIGYYSDYGTYIYNAASGTILGIKDDGTPHYNMSTIIHSGNVGDYAITSSGEQSISGKKTIFEQYTDKWSIGGDVYNLTISRSGGWAATLAYIANTYGGSTSKATISAYGDSGTINYMYLGLSENYNGNNLRIYSDNVAFGDHTLIHSGNVGDYALRYYGSDMPTNIVNYVGYGKPDAGWNTFGPAFIWGYNSYQAHLQMDIDTGVIYARKHREGTFSDWKTIAFTDSNVASADYATSAGSANVIATTYSNQSINFSHNESKLRLISSTYGDAVVNGFPKQYISGLSVITDYTGWQMVTYGSIGTPNPYFRSFGDDGRISEWKQLAFLTDNVASATKLATPRTIWGQSFDGTENVDGNMTVGNNIIYNGNNQNVIDLTSGMAFGYGLRSTSHVSYWALNHAFFSGDSRAMTINPSGNVTIGESDWATSLAKLFVQGKFVAHSVRTNEIRLGESIEGSSPYLNNWYYASIGYEYTDQTPQTLKPDIVFKTMYQTYAENSGEERMRIKANGNVLIGTTTDKLIGKLQINGNVVIGNSADSEIYMCRPYINRFCAAEAGGSFAWRVDGSDVDVMSLSTSGILTANNGIVTNEITIGGIKLDVYNGALRVNGDIFSTGQFAASVAGEATGGSNLILDYDSIVSALGYTPANNNNLAQVAFTGSYSSLSGTPDVYTKADVYNKNEINQKLAGVGGGGGSVGSTFGMDYINGQSFDMPNGVNCITSYSEATVNFSSIVPADPSLPCIVYIVKCDYHTLQVTSGCNIISVNSSGDEVIDFSINGMTGMMLVWEPDYWRWFAYLQK